MVGWTVIWITVGEETSPFPSRQIQVFQPREFKQRNKKWHTTKIDGMTKIEQILGLIF